MDLIDRQAAIEALISFFGLSIEEEYGSAIQEVLNGLPSAHRALDEWCTDCKEYDTERHCCPRFNRVIREAMKDAQPDMLGDGTLIVTVPHGTEVGRVLVQEEGTTNGALYYRDAQPRKRGKWIPKEDRAKQEVFICSVCGGWAYSPWIGSRKNPKPNWCKYLFCPNCGAEMEAKS